MHVITAAHCCTSSASSVRIVAGDYSLSGDDGTEQIRDVARVMPHPDYAPSEVSSSQDVCMLTLSTPLNLGGRCTE
jgi:trypsin